MDPKRSSCSVANTVSFRLRKFCRCVTNMCGKLSSMSRRIVPTRACVNDAKSHAHPTKWRLRAVVALVVALTSTLGFAVSAASAQSASISQSCYKDNGRFDVTLSNPAGARTTNFEVTLSGLPSRNRSIAGGQSTTVKFTGRADGLYTLQVRANGSLIESYAAQVACDPEVEVKVSCLQSNGRFDVYLSNRSSTSNTYTVFIPGLSPRSRTVAAGESSRVSATGRPDDRYDLRVQRNGQQVFSEAFDVRCDADAIAVPSNQTDVAVSCAGTKGRFDVNVFFTPDPAQPSAMFFEITTGKIQPRTAVLTQGSSFDTKITGRNDGPHEIVVRANGVVYFSKSVTVDC